MLLNHLRKRDLIFLDKKSCKRFINELCLFLNDGTHHLYSLFDTINHMCLNHQTFKYHHNYVTN